MDKQLHNDLCGRIPYLPIVEWRGEKWMLLGMVDTRPILVGMNNFAGERHIVGYNEEFKPYLRPMSSMTIDERREVRELILPIESFTAMMDAEIDFYNSHHIDFRGLIDKGLALEAPDGMYNV